MVQRRWCRAGRGAYIACLQSGPRPAAGRIPPSTDSRSPGPQHAPWLGSCQRKIATTVYEFITTTLLENPNRVGKRLVLPPFEGTWSGRRGTYRVLYEIDEENLVVTVTAIEHRADAYRSR